MPVVNEDKPAPPHSGDANNDSKADCNNDGVIGELDPFVVDRQFGK